MEEDVHRYHVEDIEVSYDANRCIHVRECVNGLPDVFDPNERPWIDLDEVDPDEVAEVVERCPTGALHHERLDGTADETPPEANTVSVAVNGPLYLYGDIELRASDGETILEDTRVALCRCGHSENKPLCDNSHERVFEADGVPTDQAIPGVSIGTPDGSEDATADRDRDSSGSVIVTLTEDGPLQIDGPFRIQNGGRGRHYEDKETSLCRCGKSSEKPYCDGTHREIGFSTDDD